MRPVLANTDFLENLQKQCGLRSGQSDYVFRLHDVVRRHQHAGAVGVQVGLAECVQRPASASTVLIKQLQYLCSCFFGANSINDDTFVLRASML